MQSGGTFTRQIYNFPKSLISSGRQKLPVNLKEIEIVIIGAGLAGLSAINHLIKSGFRRVYLIEATDRCGGRVNTKHFGDTYCELGAKWIEIDDSEHSIYELTQQSSSLLKEIKQFKPTSNTIYVDPCGQKINSQIPAVIDKLFRKLCVGININDKFHHGNMSDLDSVSAYFQAESSKLIHKNFHETQQLVAKNIFNSLFQEFGSVLGCCLEHVSIEHITKLPVRSINPVYIQNGLENILNHLTSDIEADQMKIGKPVEIIEWHTSNKAFVTCMDGSRFGADHIICTLPLGVLKNFNELIFHPKLPKEKQDAINCIGFGNPVKIYFEYEKRVNPWFMMNIRPLKGCQESLIERKWIHQVVEITKLPTSNRVLEVLIGGGYYDEIEKLPDTDLVEEVTKLLRKIFRNTRVPYPTSMLRSNWNSSACYLGGRPYFSTKSTANDISKLSRPLGAIPRLLFAGDATILNGFGTVDGARLSGIREAERIINFYKMRL